MFLIRSDGRTVEGSLYGSFIALFNDGGTDGDFDDFAVKISVSPVPLPPAVWLFISAILGLVSFTRIRRERNAA